MFPLFSIFRFIFVLSTQYFLFQKFIAFQSLYFVAHLPKNLFLIEGFIILDFVSLIELFFIHFQNLFLYAIHIHTFDLLKIYFSLLLYLPHYLPLILILIFLFPIDLKIFVC
jgi:hypothetical protein